MEQLSTFSSIADVLHALSQGLLIPDIILLMAFAGYALFCIGSILMEFFTERRAYRASMPKFLAALMDASEEDIPEVIRTSGLLNRQKTALLTVYDYRTLHDDALLALIRRTEYSEQMRYERIVGRNNTAAKISPMLGLMGTLIPLGPGVAALGQADPSALSASLIVAFDTTVAGLAVAAVCLAVGKIRSNWYGDYQSSLESAMATLLQKIEDMREAGTLQATEPTDFARKFEAGLKQDAAGTTPTAASTARAAAPTQSGSSDTSGAPGSASSAGPAHAPAAGASPTPASVPVKPAPAPASTAPTYEPPASVRPDAPAQGGSHV